MADDFSAYAMDVRGYGVSTRGAPFDAPARDNESSCAHNGVLVDVNPSRRSARLLRFETVRVVVEVDRMRRG